MSARVGAPRAPSQSLAAAGQIHGVQQLAQGVEDDQLPAGQLLPFCVQVVKITSAFAVVIQVGHDGFRGEAEEAFTPGW